MYKNRWGALIGRFGPKGTKSSSYATRGSGGTGAEERSDVATELLKKKISKDCIGVVSSYLHENDLEFVKAVFDKNYKINIKCKRGFMTEYELLCEIDWKFASEEKLDQYKYTYIISYKNYMKVLQKIYKYLNIADKVDLFKDCGDGTKDITIKNMLDYMFVHDKNTLVYMSDNLYGIGIYYTSNFMLNYLFDTLQIPINTEYDYYKPIMTEDYPLETKIDKLVWLYKHKVPLTSDVFASAINECIDNKLEIVQWLLDHNCPYK